MRTKVERDAFREEINTGPRLLKRLQQIERSDGDPHVSADNALIEFVQSKVSAELGEAIADVFEAIDKVYA